MICFTCQSPNSIKQVLYKKWEGKKCQVKFKWPFRLVKESSSFDKNSHNFESQILWGIFNLFPFSICIRKCFDVKVIYYVTNIGTTKPNIISFHRRLRECRITRSPCMG